MSKWYDSGDDDNTCGINNDNDDMEEKMTVTKKLPSFFLP